MSKFTTETAMVLIQHRVVVTYPHSDTPINIGSFFTEALVFVLVLGCAELSARTEEGDWHV